MATRKKPTQTAETGQPPVIAITPPEPAPPPPPPTRLEIRRVANGYITVSGDDFSARNGDRLVARTSAELANIVSNWATPPAATKKR